MTEFFIVLFFFGISSNVIFLLLLKFDFRKNIGDFLTLAVSYGSGPFIFSLIFYASIYFFPAKEDIFYSSILLIFCLLIFILCKKEISDLKNIHFSIVLKIIHTIKNQSIIISSIALFFIGTYSIQLLFFPIIDNDSALYLNQSEAIYEYKNIDWQKEISVTINENDQYAYNSSISSGMPLFNAATYLFQEKGERNFFVSKFLIFYYYIFLLLLFIFTIKNISKKIGFSEKKSLTWGLVFFTFSWGLSRMLIFGAKEVIIYFFALFSIYVASLLIDEKTEGKSRFYLATVIAILLGINSFINLHGIVIEAVVIFVLFVLSKNKFIDRIKEIAYIFLLSLLLGGVEFFKYFHFIFVVTLKDSLCLPMICPKRISTEIANTASFYQSFYQFTNTQKEYLRGKFQILTNIDSFGAYFWIYIVVVCKYFKKILKNNSLGFLLFFIGIYYLIVINPFKIIEHPFMIVLSGSQKYAMLLLFLSMLTASIFLDKIIQEIVSIVEKYIRVFIVGSWLLFVGIVVFKKSVVGFFLSVLSATIPMYQDASSYDNITETLYYILLLVMIVSLIMFIFYNSRKEKKWIIYLVNMLVAIVVISPLLLKNVGKVPLKKTVEYINKDIQFKLENSIYEGDIFKVYFKARNILPRGTEIVVEYKELYAYDDYFYLRDSIDNPNVKYFISADCEKENWKIITSSSNIHLCERKYK
jgi:heme/copper-type cytochrome/quinol oxidase subunit 4